ncbi:MAG: hypothetical protein Q9224_001926 [Gallowayella concinna]
MKNRGLGEEHRIAVRDSRPKKNEEERRIEKTKCESLPPLRSVLPLYCVVNDAASTSWYTTITTFGMR